MKILSIQVGKPKTVLFQGKDVTTGIFKTPVVGRVMLRTLNLEGDGQADLRVHGGKDKALYAYSVDAYPEWRKLRPQDAFGFGAMGENFSLDVAREDAVFIGDTFEVGGAIVQVTQPRFPCFKLGVMYQDAGVLKQFMTVGRPGIYYRVLKEGLVGAGDGMRLAAQEKVRLSVAEMFALYQSRKGVAPGRLAEIAGIEALPEEWKVRVRGWVGG
jgi:MOSC domain-containing protein YiiM